MQPKIKEMKKIGFIPLRQGSKGIPGKNKKKIVGRPLFSWVVAEAVFSDLDEVYVFTDDQEIIDFIAIQKNWDTKVKAVFRNEINAGDKASTESAMLEFSQKINHDYDIICLLQATSPLTLAEDINKTLKKITEEGFNSALSVVKTHRFTWNENGTPQNYDVFKRPRRQDFDGLLIENGAVYCSDKTSFLKSENRVSGKIGLVEMSEETLMEIDSLSDWNIVENLLMERQKKQKRSNRIDYLVLDVDGVFTDGCVYYNEDGEFAKKFDMRDGMGLEILRQNNVKVVVITSENSKLVAQRMKKLNIEDTFLFVKDKFSFLKNFLDERKSDFSSVAYVGDDVNDLANICSVGWSFSPNDAPKSVAMHADIITTKKAAEGAIREVCEFILKYNKRYE